MSIYVFFGMSVNANPGRACLNLITFKREYKNLCKYWSDINSLACDNYSGDVGVTSIDSDSIS